MAASISNNGGITNDKVEKCVAFHGHECGGEMTGANWIRISDGKKICLDCYKTYDRFQV